MNNKLTPYNTGKVKIGCAYVPPQKNYMTSDDVHWQNVLTGVYQRRMVHRMQFNLYVAGLLALIVVLGVTL